MSVLNPVHDGRLVGNGEVRFPEGIFRFKPPRTSRATAILLARITLPRNFPCRRVGTVQCTLDTPSPECILRVFAAAVVDD